MVSFGQESLSGFTSAAVALTRSMVHHLHRLGQWACPKKWTINHPTIDLPTKKLSSLTGLLVV
jgi:hypothetical protein